MTLLLAVLVLVVAVNCCFAACLIADVTARSARAGREPGNVLWIGVISFFQFFLSTFGISDYALGAAIYSKLKWVSSKKLPGTVNTAAVIPVAVMAFIYVTSIEVDLATLVVPIVAQAAGAFISVRFVMKMPTRPVRMFLALGMLVTVARVVVEELGFFATEGNMTALGTGGLIVLGGLCLLYGPLNNLGLGSYAPTIAAVYALGLNTTAAFPVMMGAAAFSVPVASIQFIRHDGYSRKIAVISSICGTFGVLAAAFVIKDANIFPVKWLAAGFLLYSAWGMLRSSLENRDDAEPARAPEKSRGGLSAVGRLTGFCMALVLLCVVSLVLIFVRNFRIISYNNVERSLREHNGQLSDNIHAFLTEHESVLLSARVGVARFMSRHPVDLEQLRLYLEESARILDDISTLYCTTNEVWNQPGGYAVFSQPWDVPRDWDNTKRPWFTGAREAEGKVVCSMPYIDALTGALILDISAEVCDEQGNDVGVISMAITIQSLNDMLRRHTVLERQRVFLINSDGVFVVHPDKNMAGRENFFTETGLERYRDDILSGESFFATVSDTAVFSSPIPSAGWYVVSVVPVAELFSSSNEQLFSIFLTPMLIIFFMLLVVLISLLIITRREIRDKFTAERLTREKDFFIARISHELRTPMNAIIGMSELARRDYGTPGGLEYISGIKKASMSLLSIINDLLDFSRIESGRLELNPAPYEAASMLDDVLAIVRVQMAGKPLKLVVNASPDIPRSLTGDEGRVKQVLLNLLSNAVKYTDEGFISLRFFASKDKEDDDTARLTFIVEDSGTGIKAEDMPKLFGDFERVDEKRNGSIEGAGLGLSIARSLCRTMGGDITVRSEYGKGSVFTATLAQTAAGREAMSGAAAVSETRAGEFSAASIQRVSFTAPDAEVLVADDLPANLTVAEGLLRPYKMRVYTCLNGRQALERIQSRPYDLVLMDHMMPEMDGIETVSAIRAAGGRFAELPVVVLTAHAIYGMKEMFLANGFDDFLSKPIDPARLDALLQRWIPAEKRQGAPEDSAAAPLPSISSLPSLPMNEAVGMAGVNKAELAAQRLDLLKHYRWHFEKGLPADQEYCEKFSALVEAITEAITEDAKTANAAITEEDVPIYMRARKTADLAAAGRRGDVEEINRLLPDAYEAIASLSVTDAAWDERGASDAKGALFQLKTALDKGDAQSAEAAMEELRVMGNLSPSMRELYFLLYDALFMGETEKAAGALAAWKIFFGR